MSIRTFDASDGLYGIPLTVNSLCGGTYIQILRSMRNRWCFSSIQMLFKPHAPYKNSIVTSCKVAVGAKRAQMGMNPLQKDKNPSFCASFTVQSKNPLYVLVFPWFMRAVRIRSKGLTVHVMASPLHIEEQNVVRRSFRLHPVASATKPLA
jgi:hypothetical protein